MTQESTSYESKSHVVKRILGLYAPSPAETEAAEEIVRLEQQLEEERRLSDALFVSLVNHGYSDDNSIYKKTVALQMYKRMRAETKG